jgi:hypothetical protein
VVATTAAPSRDETDEVTLEVSAVIRYERVIVLEVTPGEVAPPLFPEKAIHGGE